MDEKSNQNTAAAPEFVNKLTYRLIGGDDTDRMPMGDFANILGVVRNTFSKQTAVGVAICLEGDFEAQAIGNCKNAGQTFRSTKLWPHKSVAETIVRQLEKQPEGVPFALTVAKSPATTKNAAKPFEFVARPRVNTNYDPLAAARKLLPAG